MKDSTTIFDLIRHGEPEGGPMFRGSKDDPLSDTGWQQMRNAIADHEHWDLVLTSPLQRCQAFARELATAKGISLEVEPGFRELHFGDWEGRTAANILEHTPEAISRFWSDPVACPPPGGEALADFSQRIQESWLDWRQRAEGKRVLLVCHGGVIGMLLAQVMSIPLERSFSAIRVPYACRSRLRVDNTEHGIMSCLESHGPVSL
ncbi:histidine phosphatase family protein [Marinobacter confluentis]|uniref:Histidine phosphatase family protein n=1 Tax=Marinobacter confluentis TaxID=1697557 RepID=A0A4Z1BP95_9GAMM|nr:alpha-ribazole phosphatase family protein [Marinobacter confluentis]TGN39317.1 histidine phosphatase family protein [Marinobacter confluentis]